MDAGTVLASIQAMKNPFHIIDKDQRDLRVYTSICERFILSPQFNSNELLYASKTDTLDLCQMKPF